MEFDSALAAQEALRERVLGGGPPRLLLVEHPPVLTIGRRGSRDDVLWDSGQLRSAGIDVFETPRGGQVTLHAPGQLVVYPIVYVGRQIRRHLHTLAEVTIKLLEEQGVVGARYVDEQPGVWVSGAKLASIGIHVRRGVAIQGLSLNLSVDRGLFSALVSCGTPGLEIVNVTEVGGQPIAVEQAAHRWAELYGAATGQELVWVRLAA